MGREFISSAAATRILLALAALVIKWRLKETHENNS